MGVYLDRIGRLDGRLNGYRTVRWEQARAEAIEAQRRLEAGERLPLLGVALAIKDDVDVAGEVTAWGTAAYGGVKERDAEVVRRLRDAGAIVIGKTNCPEMTIWPFTESPTFGATRNPWDTSRSPVAAAVAQPWRWRPASRPWAWALTGALDSHASGMVRCVWTQTSARPGASGPT